MSATRCSVRLGLRERRATTCSSSSETDGAAVQPLPHARSQQAHAIALSPHVYTRCSNNSVAVNEYGDSIDPGYLGAALAYVIQLGGLFQWAVRQSAEVENQVSCPCVCVCCAAAACCVAVVHATAMVPSSCGATAKVLGLHRCHLVVGNHARATVALRPWHTHACTRRFPPLRVHTQRRPHSRALALTSTHAHIHTPSRSRAPPQPLPTRSSR
jgi:hypothetical protein